jgi:hypothetical protein
MSGSGKTALETLPACIKRDLSAFALICYAGVLFSFGLAGYVLSGDAFRAMLQFAKDMKEGMEKEPF